MASGLLRLSGGEEQQAKAGPNRRLIAWIYIVGVVAWLSSRVASHVNGAVIPVDGGGRMWPRQVKRRR